MDDTFHDAVDDADPTYRRLSPLAVLAAVAGLASSAALIAPLLRLVPVVGIVLAVFALRQLAGRGESLTGRGLALVGLALALGFGAAAYAKDFVEARLHRAAASQLATHFLQLLAEDRPAAALELTLDYSQRRSESIDFDAAAAENETAAERLMNFKSEPLIKAVLELDKPQVKLLDSSSPGISANRVAMSQSYELAAVDRKVHATVILDRAPARGLQAAAWRIAQYAPKSTTP